MVLLYIVICVTIFDDHHSKYWRVGPQPDLVLVSIKIDTMKKYIFLMVSVALIKISQCIIGEIAHPIIGFNIYNPDKKIIVDFTKNELQFYGNIMYFIDSVRSVLMVIMSITQIDIALFGVLCTEVTGIFTIRMLLNEKTFSKSNEHDYEMVDNT